MSFVFFKKKRIDNGQQKVTEWTLLEWKPLGSIKLFFFHPTNGVQDRFHTHAFNAVSILLKGDYVEEVIAGRTVWRKARSRSRFLYIPKGEFHRITRSKGCWTLLFTGPWEPTWKELRARDYGAYQEFTCGEHRTDLQAGGYRHLRED